MGSQDRMEIKKWIWKIWLLWTALFYTPFVYIRLCYLKENDIPYFAGANLPLKIIKVIFIIVAFCVLYFAYYYRKRLLKNSNIKFNQRIIQRAERIKKPPIFLKYFADVIFSVAISLCSGFLGLIYFFISKDWQTLYGSIVLSAIAIIYFRPKLKEFEQYLSKNRIKGDGCSCSLIR